GPRRSDRPLRGRPDHGRRQRRLRGPLRRDRTAQADRPEQPHATAPTTEEAEEPAAPAGKTPQPIPAQTQTVKPFGTGAAPLEGPSATGRAQPGPPRRGVDSGMGERSG